jgi:branched-chain amino acid transport system substrate-binding protein
MSWVTYTNSHGGINGHPVHLIYMDDGTNPATALQDVQKMVQSDHILALMDNSLVDSAFQSYIDSAKVPVISINAAETSFLWDTDKNFFSNMTTASASIYLGMKSISIFGYTKDAFLYCAEVAGCKQAAAPIKSDGEAVGVHVVYTGSISASAPNYSAQCLAAKAAGAEILQIAAYTAVETERLAADCLQQGFSPAEYKSAIIPSAAYGKPGLTNVVGIVNGSPWFLPASTPQLKAFHTTMDSYLPKAQDPQNVELAWAAMEMFKTTVLNGGDNPTPQTVYNGLYSLKGSTIGGLTTPLSFIKGQFNYVNCGFPVQYKNGKWTAPNGTTPLCAHNVPGEH